MPHRASATKSLRQSKTRQQRNKPARSRLTTETRGFERAVQRGDAEAAQRQFDLLTKLLQKAATKGIIKANTAARRQARFQKQLNSIAAAGG